MLFWKQAPFFRVLIPFVLGIVLARYAPIDPKYTGMVIATFCILVCIPRFVGKLKIGLSWLLLEGVFVWLIFFGLGMVVFQLNQPINQTTHFTQSIHSPLIVKVVTQPKITQSGKFYSVETEAIRKVDDKKVKLSKGGVLVYYPVSSICNLKYGDLIKIPYPDSFSNPELTTSFDFKSYYKSSGIHGQVFLKDSIHYVGEGNRNMLYVGAFAVQQKGRALLKKHFQGDVLAVLEALFLGYKSDLTPEVKSSFSTSGTIHVLAVSGLHLGVIYVVLAFLFNFIRLNKWLKALLITIGLWAFALLTGFSSSVCRAALMFSLLQWSYPLKRKSYVFNTIALSCFILLLVNPQSLFLPGFQLSYAAVTGIVVLYPMFTDWWVPKNNAIKKLYQLMLVSVTAQIGTLPFILYYFHQFPTYFIFSNLIIVPIITITIWLGVMFILVSGLPALAAFLSIIINKLVSAVLWSSHIVETLPYSLITKIHPSLFEMILLGAFIVFGTAALLLKRKKYLITTLVLVVGFQIASIIRNINYSRQNEVIVSKDASSFIIILHGTEGRYWVNPGQSEKILKYELQPFFDAKGVRNVFFDTTLQLEPKIYQDSMN